jgi:hypothetical protein
MSESRQFQAYGVVINREASGEYELSEAGTRKPRKWHKVLDIPEINASCACKALELAVEYHTTYRPKELLYGPRPGDVGFIRSKSTGMILRFEL